MHRLLLTRRSLTPLSLKYILKPYDGHHWGEFIYKDSTITTLTCYDSATAFPIGEITFDKTNQTIINIDVANHYRRHRLAICIAQLMIKVCNGEEDVDYVLRYERVQMNSF